jgi:RNA polymerase sigma-70 factor (ECF subfamily)
MPVDGTALEGHLRDAVRQRYGESRAARYSISAEEFEIYVAAVVAKYAAGFTGSEKLELIASLRLEELVLARACTAGNATAWDEFLARFKATMRSMAVQITRSDSAGSDLADELYAELYGMPNREGRRTSKLDYYMGRGSLQGWLRTVLAQKHVDRCRAQSKNVSLEEQVEAGATFAAKDGAPVSGESARVAQSVEQALATLSNEERFLLASYYLDRRTLAEIGRQLGAHESTISRKLDRATIALRKTVRQDLQADGLSPGQCDDLLDQLDVRDLNVDIERNLRQERRQERSSETFKD